MRVEENNRIARRKVVNRSSKQTAKCKSKRIRKIT